MNADTSAAQPNAAQTVTLPATTTPIPGPAPAAPSGGSSREEPIRLDAVLGVVAVLPEADQMKLMTLECSISESIAQGWKSFVDIGLALLEIKKEKLYRAEFGTFEDYCRIKWDFQHSKANYLMAAAEIMKSIAALPDVPKPERESPIRPLLKLNPDDVQRAWKLAVERTGGRRITARVVKCAIQSLQLAGNSVEPASPKYKKVDRHRVISDCFGELLKLLSKRADYSSVIEKVQELHGHVEGLFQKRKAHSSALS